MQPPHKGCLAITILYIYMEEVDGLCVVFIVIIIVIVKQHSVFVKCQSHCSHSVCFPPLQYEASPAPTVTCAVYSGNGDAILASYNDDDIYLFDTMLSEASDAVHKYSGHRNNATGL